MSYWRFALTGVALLALPLALAWHLAHLQVVPGAEKGFRFLQSEGEARTLRNAKINAYRGVITDRNGELLAVSTPVKTIYANPQRIDPQELPELAKALNMKEAKLRARLTKYQNKQFVYLSRQLPPHEADSILNQRFSGVSSEQGYRRYYPAGEVTAHAIGFTDVNDKGQEGIELAYDQWLAGAPGAKRIVKDLKGNVVKEIGLLKSPKSGSDLKLTIDLRLQYLAYKELKSSITKQRAKSGSLVMMDVKTGQVLAMVNQPSYNPNDRSKVKAYQLRNRAFTDVFEPGSTMKPFAMMAALETGRYTPTYKINTSPGHFRVRGKTILDPVNYGVINLSQIIAKSSQVGMSKLALELQPDNIRDMYFRAGFGQNTGTGFPGENSGFLPSHAKWHPTEVATFSYGYGLSVNAVQLAQAYGVIASGGKFTPTTLLMNVAQESSQQVVAPKVAGQVASMLKKVVERGGTGTRARLDAYTVAGKSGTIHKAKAGGYADDKYMALFVGFAPAVDPEIVVAVIVNEPPADGEYFGGQAAAPVFGAVVDKALRVLSVPPTIKPTLVSGR